MRSMAMESDPARRDRGGQPPIMSLRGIGVAAALLALLLASPCSATPRYRLDPVHTQVVFFVSHMGFSNSMGVFREVRGHFDFDERDWSTARAEVEVELASLDFGDEAWQRNTLARPLLDAERHPTMRFVGERLERTGEDTGRLHGLLTLRGQTRPLVLDVRLNRVGLNPLTLRRTAGFSATGQLSRSAFGVSGHAQFIGDTVHLRIEVEGLLEHAE